MARMLATSSAWSMELLQSVNAQPMRGRSRAAGPVVFWQCDPVCDQFCAADAFVFLGHFVADPERRPEMWRRDGTWSYERGEKSPQDLIFNNTKI